MINSAWIAAGLASLVGFVLMYIDTKLFSEERSRFVYLRNMVLNGLLVGCATFLMGSPSITDGFKQSGGVMHTVSDLGESMLTGEPNF